MINIANEIIAIGVVNSLTTHFVLAFQAAPSGMTSARAAALLAVGIGLVSVVLGGVALARARGRLTGSGLAWSIMALVLGFIGIAVSGVLLATSAGIGTGGGSLGAIVAMLLSLIGAALGGVAFAGSRRSQSTD
jgi:hypothetical protein